jgi:hypothetical protein
MSRLLILALAIALGAPIPALLATGCADADNTIVGEPNNRRMRGSQNAELGDRNANLNRNEPVSAADVRSSSGGLNSGQRPPEPPQRFTFGVVPTCVFHECVCPAGTELCGMECFDLDNDPENCGECGEGCDADEVCLRGECD